MRYVNFKDPKAPGPDGITSEMLKVGDKQLHTTLLKHADLISARHGTIPNQLNLTEIIVLFKKGDLLYCNKYRSISLFSVLSMGISKVARRCILFQQQIQTCMVNYYYVKC